MTEDTISGQLKKNGIKDIAKFKPLTVYFGDRSSNGAFDMYWTNTIQSIKGFNKYTVVLFDHHEWSDMGGGIQMSKQVFVIHLDKLAVSEEIVYRHGSNPSLDNWSLDFDEILTVRKNDDNIIVRLRNKKRGCWEQDVHIRTS